LCKISFKIVFIYYFNISKLILRIKNVPYEMCCEPLYICICKSFAAKIIKNCQSAAHRQTYILHMYTCVYVSTYLFVSIKCKSISVRLRQTGKSPICLRTSRMPVYVYTYVHTKNKHIYVHTYICM